MFHYRVITPLKQFQEGMSNIRKQSCSEERKASVTQLRIGFVLSPSHLLPITQNTEYVLAQLGHHSE